MCLGKLIAVLVRMGAEFNSDFQILHNPPNVVVDLLAREKAGIICYNRLNVQYCYFQASLTKK